jgi:hypothetical protein
VGRKTSLDGAITDQSVSSGFFAWRQRQAFDLLKEMVLKAEPKNDPRRLTREEAKHTLDEVRRRYGIHDSDPRANPGAGSASKPPVTSAKKQPRHTVTHQPFASRALIVPVERMRSEPNREPQKIRDYDTPAYASPPDNQIFHYLIQIAECAVALHCEVTATCESDARHHVKQIPNLMEWREISGAELADIIKIEKARSKNTKKARFRGAVAAISAR